MDAIKVDFPNITLLKTNNNSGAAKARLFGLEKVRTEWVAFLDADDVLSENAIYNAFEVIQKTGAELCAWNIELVDPTGMKIIGDIPVSIQPEEIINGVEAARLSLDGWKMHANGICKASIWQSAHKKTSLSLFDADEIVSRYLLAESKFVTVCNSKYFYRQHKNSTTKVHMPLPAEALLKTKSILDFCEEYKLLEIDPLLVAEIIKTGADSAWSFFRADPPDKSQASLMATQKAIKMLIKQIQRLIYENSFPTSLRSRKERIKMQTLQFATSNRVFFQMGIKLFRK